MSILPARSTAPWGALCAVAAIIVAAAPVWAQLKPVGTEFQINSYTVGDQGRDLAVSAASTGEFVVVWSSYPQDSPDTSGVFGQRFDSGGAPAGPEFQINTHTEGDQGQAGVAVTTTGNGDFVVAWDSYDQDGESYGVFAQRFDSSGVAIGAEFQVNTYTESAQGYRGPAVAAAPNGDFVVVWTSYGQDGSAGGVFGQRFDSTGAPLGSEFQVNTYTENAQGYTGVAVAADGNGGFVVVWDSFGQTFYNVSVFGQRYDSSGAPVGTEFRVNTAASSDQGYYTLDVATRPNGDFIVVWDGIAGADGDEPRVFARRYASNGAPQGLQFQVSTLPTPYLSRVAATVGSNGDFVVAWNGAAGADVRTRRYASSGAPTTDDFRVNTHTLAGDFGVDVAADSGGNFVVAWDSYDQDGDGEGVFGQRFASICSGGATIDRPRITLVGLGLPIGDERLVFKGRLRFAPGQPAVFNPTMKGAQVLIEDVGSGNTAILDLTSVTTPVPPTVPGAGCNPREGWKANAAGTRHVYTNRSNAIDPPACTPASAKGLLKVTFIDKRATRGEIHFLVRARGEALPFPVLGPLRGTIVLGATGAESGAGDCGSHTFEAAQCVSAKPTKMHCR